MTVGGVSIVFWAQACKTVKSSKPVAVDLIFINLFLSMDHGGGGGALCLTGCGTSLCIAHLLVRVLLQCSDEVLRRCCLGIVPEGCQQFHFLSAGHAWRALVGYKVTIGSGANPLGHRKGVVPLRTCPCKCSPETGCYGSDQEQGQITARLIQSGQHFKQSGHGLDPRCFWRGQGKCAGWQGR